MGPRWRLPEILGRRCDGKGEITNNEKHVRYVHVCQPHISLASRPQATCYSLYASRFDEKAEDPDRISDTWPDLLLIDGGLGQLSSVHEALDELALSDLQVVAISKGPDRHAGREQFHIRGRPSFTLPPDSAAMHFLQRLRDEAHRYAIGTHRNKRAKAEFTNPLDAVPGIGPKRKKALLAHFGSARAVAVAGLTDLQAVDGISKKFAQQIYDWFYSGGQ